VATYVTGGSGRLGGEVLKLMDAVPLVRRPSGLKGEIVTDFSPESLKGQLSDADSVVHLAGSMRFWDRKDLWETNHALTKNLVDACPPDCNFHFASSITVYGKQMAEIPADENTPLNPDTEYAKSKAAAEQEARRMKHNSIFRIAVIYGPGYYDYYSVFRMMRKGKMMILGGGGNRLPFVHVEDAASAIASAHAKKATGAYVLCGGPVTQSRCYELAAEALGCAPPSKHVSPKLALAYAKLEETLGAFTGAKPMFTSEHIRILSSDRAFDSSKAGRGLGFRPRPIGDGIREMAKEYLAQQQA